ncbi:MAG: polyamine ABC transporter substrate-binding protein [Comamonas sp.]
MSSFLSTRLRIQARHALNAVLGAALLAGLAGGARAEEEKVLNIYNWSDYIAPDTVANFEKETGIKVRYDVFDNNEIVNAKLVAGKTGYDIVVPSSYWAKLQLDAGLFQKIDKSKIPNYPNLNPAIVSYLGLLDPGNQYLVDWLWGFNTIGYNLDKVKAALGGLPLPDNAWDLLFKPEYASKLKRCGISVLDSPTDMVAVALLYLGKSPFSSNPADYDQAKTLLASLRPSVTLFSSSGYINDLASGSLCLVQGYSGDINIARHRAIDGKTGQNIVAYMPKSGAMIFMDTMAIPADAPHPDNAHKWINYILRPEVQASLTQEVYYANPTSQVSQKSASAELAKDEALYPSKEQLDGLMSGKPDVLQNSTRRLMTRLFTAFKTGL